MPRDKSIKHVLIIGSGPIVIGQACEFDYSGSQAARSLREEGIQVTLLNSNPATIMTDPVVADNVYLDPICVESIIKILEEQNARNNPIDAVLPTMGGQTALNLYMEAAELKIWEKYNVKVLGADAKAIEKTEDREKFRQWMISLGIGVAKGIICNSFLEGKEAAQKIGFPLVIRPSYTLGGTGGSFVLRKEEFEEKLKRGLEASPVHEVLVEQAVLGWKEFELEVMKDISGNFVVICTVENFDPMGIHTGDSITVAPAMTLSDTTFQKMRNYAKTMICDLPGFAGGCNIQFAVHPETEDIISIEMNPRVSRSSALASKATGYPIAKIAAKLAIGYTLDELKNQITKTTSAFFEPALDYVIVKIPRWNFDKFPGCDDSLGLQMKAVGEVMAIGRNFQEALQKACQSLENNRIGLGCDGKQWVSADDMLKGITVPSWDRIFRIYDALKLGVPLKTIHEVTKIDPWFLNQILDLVSTEKKFRKRSLHSITADEMFELKQKGYSDLQIAWLTQSTEDEVYKYRTRELNIRRVYKLVDTCAAEFEALTPYYYSTFEKEAQQINLTKNNTLNQKILIDNTEQNAVNVIKTNESQVSEKKKIIVLGSGPNRIGQGIEFDYCCVHGVLAIKEAGFEAIMINCNPETVSTDPDIADKLYFEPVFWEHLRELIEHENPEGVIVQLGGQTALKLSRNLYENNIKIIGTSFDSMDIAEDRERFSNLLKSLDIPYPDYGAAKNAEEALEVAHRVGYPVLVRPSYVLGGQRMRIVINDEELTKSVVSILKFFPDNNILIDHFLDRAEEAEIDAIYDGEQVEIMGTMEHVEPAGIHSGDSNAVLPPYNLSEKVQHEMRDYTRRIAKALNIRGLLNVQFAIKDEKVYVIEA
ncbi:MAG: carbamoyl-phosphate synthase large subunit, partial [Chitinophagales bacterium]|nr:carbamoyl-phosphate synthase large subunit [Chitinophagales bacterium]MDW8274618.1 carbamoyl-phosphate synthase large subunit [Chitinophagales bacterium]